MHKVAEWSALAAGLLAVLLSSNDHFTESSRRGIDVSRNVSAWSGYGALGVVLVLASTVLVARFLLMIRLDNERALQRLTAAFAVLGSLILAGGLAEECWGNSNPGLSVRPGWAGWLMLLLSLALSVLSIRAALGTDAHDPEPPSPVE
jgi:drug/metabolite transporter (DMT)-like permease